MLSVFCPYRNRKPFYWDFINHYRHHFPDAKIYMLEQNDLTLFKRGQLMNAGFKYLLDAGVAMENIVFTDIDIRMQTRIDFEGLLDQHPNVVIPYNQLLLYYLSSNGQYISENKPSYFLEAPDGGVTLFSKDTFLKCNGFSNLYIGWGREDSDFVRRNTVIRVANTLIHLTHVRHQEWSSSYFKRNDEEFQHPTNPQQDGFRQTIADFYIQRIAERVFHCKIKNIGVVSDYAYRERLACGVR